MKPLFIGINLLLAGGGAMSAEPQRYPDVVSARVQPRASDTFDFDVTVSSPYDTPTRYADAFRVMGQDGVVFGKQQAAARPRQRAAVHPGSPWRQHPARPTRGRDPGQGSAVRVWWHDG